MTRFLWTIAFLATISLAPTALAGQAGINSVSAHRIDLPSFGGPVDITTPWLLAQGDDPPYADPNYDDSKWVEVTPGTPLESYGFHDPDQIWYRKHLHLAPGTHNLALIELNLLGTWQLFANGVEVGEYGRQITGGDFTYTSAQTMTIPDSVLGVGVGVGVGDGDLVLAVRTSMRRLHEFDLTMGGFGLNCFMRIGNASDINEAYSLLLFQSYTSNTINFILKVLLAILALVLALTLRRDREYLALLIYASANTIAAYTEFWRAFHNYSDSMASAVWADVLDLVSYIALLEFIRLVLKISRSRILSSYVVLFLVSVVVEYVVMGRWKFFGDGTHFPASIRWIIHVISIPYLYGLPFFALWVALRRRNRDALLLFFPLLFNSGYDLFFALRNILLALHGPILTIPMNSIPGLYFQWDEVGTFLYTLALLVFLVLRTVRVAGNRVKIAAEIEAARTMQRLLLARSSELTPGFLVETVYLPAGEVGGDFFLVSPGPDQSLTAIVGDVSGKGLAAAMRVSMILGVLRREESRDPGTILAHLNDALLAQSEAGFTTACCVRLDRQGRYTVANAGHIQPYIAGTEIETPPAFPLGIAGQQTYDAVEGRLDAGARLVLMSDGVVEARSAKGELYGFDRVATLSVRRAQEIADTAQAFGQDDDITVLTIACA